MEYISEKNKRRLIKKWKQILTRYTKYEKNWRVRTYKRWLTNVTVDLSLTKEFYIKKIDMAKKILSSLS